MTFIDTNVFMYAVGRPHPLRLQARDFLIEAMRNRTPLFTSAEVLQELAHAYLPAGRLATLDAAMTLVARCGAEVWPLEAEDVTLAANCMNSIQRCRPAICAILRAAADVAKAR